MKRHPFLLFAVLMLVFSWALWLPLALAPGAGPFKPDTAYRLGTFGPCLAALLVLLLFEGVEGLRALFSRLLLWRVGAGWYLVALLLPAAVSLLLTLLCLVFGGKAPNFADPPIYRVKLTPEWLMQYDAWTLLLPVFLHKLILGEALGVELGWRGFALTRLQQGRSALLASLVLAVLWAVWSLPLQAPSSGGGLFLSFLRALLHTIPGAIVSTWIYNGTGGSLLLMVLYYNSQQITDWFLAPPMAGPVLPVLVYWLLAFAILAVHGPLNLSHRERAQPVTAH
jgi:membrane protease YdiL (CAAX protease family)